MSCEANLLSLKLGEVPLVAASVAAAAAKESQLTLLHLGPGLLLPMASSSASKGTDCDEMFCKSRDDVALVLHTSGSTRRPKLVPLTHSNLCTGALCIASTLRIQTHDVFMNCLPLFHIHGLVVNVLVPAIAGATSLCLQFDAARVVKALKGEQVSVYSAVPSIHQAILEATENCKSFPPLRLIRNCSAHLPATLASSLSKFGEVLPTYAMTESMPIASPIPKDLLGTVHGTVGFAAGPDIRLRINSDLMPLREGLSGEVCVKGPCVTHGYEVRDIDPNLDAFENGWLRTGDLGTVTSDGLILTGRCKEIINKAGEKFSPLQIEDVYLRHTLIHDCAAFAMPCEKRGEAIGLAIESETQTSLDLLRMFGRRQELRLQALPDCVIWMKELPRSATGKKLRLGFAERLGLPTLHGDHAEWTADTRPEGSVALRPAERFQRAVHPVRRIAEAIVRCELSEDEPLLDSGIDSLSATTFINELESQLKVNLSGDESAMVFLERHSSLRKVAEAVRALSPKAPYVDFRDPSTLLYAAQHGDEHTLRRRCSEGLLVDEEVDKFGLTALHYAAGRGDLQILRLLLELGAAVDMRSKDLRTPLMWAARNGHVELCSELLRHSADIHAANKLGICCLHWAAWGGSLQAVAFLLEQMADINSVCHAGCNVAVWAATAGSLEVCQWLHEKRADFTKLNKNGHGVLNKAAWRGHDVKLMSFMLALDGVEAQLYEPDWEGELPLDRACQRGHVALADWMYHEMSERRPSWQRQRGSTRSLNASMKQQMTI